MADSSERVENVLVQGEVAQLSAESLAAAEKAAQTVDAVLAHEHGPNHESSMHAAEAAAVFASLATASGVASGELHAADERAIKSEVAALGSFKTLSSKPNPVVPFRFRSYTHPERLAYDGMFHGSVAHAFGALYAHLMEEGITGQQGQEDQKGINSAELLIADQLYDKAENDPELMADLLAIAAESGAQELRREYEETARGTVEEGATHAVKEDLGRILTSVHGEELLHLPLVERARQLGGKALHLGAPAAPYGGVVVKHVEDLGNKLNQQGANAAQWMELQTGRVIEGVLGTAVAGRGNASLDAVIQGMQVGGLVPRGANRAELGRALLTRAASRYPEHIFADNATGTVQEVGLYLTLAAMFDINEKLETSSILRYLERQKQTAAAVTAAEVDDTQPTA